MIILITIVVVRIVTSHSPTGIVVCVLGIFIVDSLSKVVDY